MHVNNMYCMYSMTCSLPYNMVHMFIVQCISLISYVACFNYTVYIRVHWPNISSTAWGMFGIVLFPMVCQCDYIICMYIYTWYIYYLSCILCDEPHVTYHIAV